MHMRLKVIAVILIVFGSATAGGALFARGPVGPATIVHKDVMQSVSSSATRINAVVVATSGIPPSSFELPRKLCANIKIKQAISLLSNGHTIPEYAEEYLVRDSLNRTEHHCVVRIFGDCVVGVGVWSDSSVPAATNRFRASLAQMFPGYVILQGRNT